MKKQIFIFLIVLLGVTSTVFGQTLKNSTTGNLTGDPTTFYCVDPTPITATCVADADPLHPSLGVLYTYTIEVTPTVAAPDGYIHWLVTTSPNIIVDGILTTAIQTAAGPYILAAGTTYNDNTNITPSVNISWESVPTTDDLFLVTYVKDNNGCTDNIKVYKIEPQHIFTLDLAYLNATNPTVVGANTDCVAPVWTAEYLTATETMSYDYGQNQIFFVVNAANWGHSWKPSFQIDFTGAVGDTGLTASTTFSIDWATPAGSVAGTWNNATKDGAAMTWTSATNVTPSSGDAVGTDGECIIVRVTIDYGQNETTQDIPFSFAVNGVMYDGTGYTNPLLGDIHYADGPGDVCPWYDGFTNDKLNYTLTLRPTVADATPDTPNPTDFIPSNAQQP